MARGNKKEDTLKVAEMLPPRGQVKVGKPGKIITSALRSKMAFPMSGMTTTGSGGNFYSPELSTDFLELPQTVDEQRNYYRFFYKYEPFVAQAIDQHTELPLSKIRIAMPAGARSRELAKKATRWIERWAKTSKLLRKLISITHEYHLIGESIVFCEDTSPEMPREIWETPLREVAVDGTLKETWTKRDEKDSSERALEWLNKHYKGWTAIRTLPPEQIQIESFPFTDKQLIELVPDSKTKAIIQKAQQGDPRAAEIAESMPNDVVQAILDGRNVPLNTDPQAGSFVFVMARKKCDYEEERGQSILQRCMRTLVFRDKVRQSLTSIASRHMTPYRLIYAEDMDDEQTDALREQVDLCLQDPDYSIITNFQVNWEEMGADQRLPDWSWVWDFTDRQLYAGLGVTESLLSGESSYSGDRINLEVINTRYMLYRELIQEMVEDYIFKPMCERMGFMEKDEDGNLVPLVPRISFTRLALRDNSDTFDALFNLYQKGSVDIDVILDLLNIDPETTKEKLERDLFTINDSTFNEALRGIYTRTGDMLAENSDAAEKIAANLGLAFERPKGEDEGRF